MPEAWTSTIDGLLEEAVASGTVPGAAVIVTGRDGVLHEGAAGVAVGHGVADRVDDQGAR